MRKKILITGASGFIGSYVCKKFPDHKVVAIISPFSNQLRDVVPNSNFSILKLDLINKEALDSLFKKNRPDVVIHLATHGVYQYQQNDEDRIIKDNYFMTLNLLEVSVKYGIEKFINTGSVFEYGSRKGKVREEDVDLKDILNEYSAVKMATTALSNSFANRIKVITLRPFTTYGPGEDRSRFIRLTIERALKNEPIKLVKGVVRDFVYVDDVADAYFKASNTDYISGGIINIGSGKKSTLEMAAYLIKKLTKSRSEIVFNDEYVRNKESGCWANVSKAEDLLCWKPKNSLESGLIKTVDWVKSN